MSDVSDNLPHRNLSARLIVEAFFRTCSAQMCGERSFTRTTGESEVPPAGVEGIKTRCLLIGQERSKGLFSLE